MVVVVGLWETLLRPCKPHPGSTLPQSVLDNSIAGPDLALRVKRRVGGVEMFVVLNWTSQLLTSEEPQGRGQ